MEKRERERKWKIWNLTSTFLLFCQVIAMIKGLYGQIVRLEPMFSEVIKHSVHTEVQQFIQVNLREPLRKAVKSKKATLLKTWVQMLSTICGCCIFVSNCSLHLFPTHSRQFGCEWKSFIEIIVKFLQHAKRWHWKIDASLADITKTKNKFSFSRCMYFNVLSISLFS